jgi:OmpA-OmpF porin, OOP family
LYVNQQVVPIIDKVNALDQLTSENTHDIAAVNDRAQQGIAGADSRVTDVNEKATASGRAADEANQRASGAAARTDSLAKTLENMDNFQSSGATAVQFPAGGSELDQKATAAIDDFVARVPATGNYILTLQGSTDAAGGPEFNYELSKRRAMAVSRYLVSKFHIQPYRMFSVGLGPDRPVALNKTSAGRARNRRVDVALFVQAPIAQADDEQEESTAAK